jgi:hypothetical protein
MSPILMPRFKETDGSGEGVADGSGLCVAVGGMEVSLGAGVEVIVSRPGATPAGAQAVSRQRRKIKRARFISGLYS